MITDRRILYLPVCMYYACIIFVTTCIQAFIAGSCHCVNVKGSFGPGSPDLVSIETLGEQGNPLSLWSPFMAFIVCLLFL